ncbi:hypothetical protein KP509_35G035200 [Ceratopteris richardii]|uniref:Uncharacterized protein n=1 Tax=Ceratopteris richardii TaxID=49495 RepID=A0A8T2QEH4_CERRI|nr:hypothetical protein KP509_35G035200 [Ceratopteris richardii]
MVKFDYLTMLLSCVKPVALPYKLEHGGMGPGPRFAVLEGANFEVQLKLLHGRFYTGLVIIESGQVAHDLGHSRSTIVGKWNRHDRSY